MRKKKNIPISKMTTDALAHKIFGKRVTKRLKKMLRDYEHSKLIWIAAFAPLLVTLGLLLIQSLNHHNVEDDSVRSNLKEGTLILCNDSNNHLSPADADGKCPWQHPIWEKGI
jgi:hypothetical protein